MKAGISASEVAELLRLSTTKEIKDKLKSTTQEALNHGVSEITSSYKLKIYSAMFLDLPELLLFFQAFGFPLMVCHVDGKPEVFFGSDRFELMAHCIGRHFVIPQV